MGCAASTSVNAVVPMMPPPKDAGVVADVAKHHVSCALEAKQVVKQDIVVNEIVTASDNVVEVTSKADVEPADRELSDEERSKNTTPYSTNNQGLGCTTPPNNKQVPDDLSVSPDPKDDLPLLPSMLEPLPAPSDVDSIALPSDGAELQPYWEREPLPARPGTSSRRPQSSGGKKLVVYKTEKTKKLEAEAKKKRGVDGTSPEKQAEKKAPSSLPPIKARRKKVQSDDVEVMTPVKSGSAGHEWTGSTGGEAWSVDICVPHAPRKESLGADMELRREGSSDKRTADVFPVDDADAESPIRPTSQVDVFTMEEED